MSTCCTLELDRPALSTTCCAMDASDVRDTGEGAPALEGPFMTGLGGASFGPELTKLEGSCVGVPLIWLLATDDASPVVVETELAAARLLLTGAELLLAPEWSTEFTELTEFRTGFSPPNDDDVKSSESNKIQNIIT